MLPSAVVESWVWGSHASENESLKALRRLVAEAALEQVEQDSALVALADASGAQRLVVLFRAAERLVRRAMEGMRPVQTPGLPREAAVSGTEETLSRLHAAVLREHTARRAWLESLPEGSCTNPPPASLLAAEAETARILSALGPLPPPLPSRGLRPLPCGRGWRPRAPTPQEIEEHLRAHGLSVTLTEPGSLRGSVAEVGLWEFRAPGADSTVIGLNEGLLPVPVVPPSDLEWRPLDQARAPVSWPAV